MATKTKKSKKVLWWESRSGTRFRSSFSTPEGRKKAIARCFNCYDKEPYNYFRERLDFNEINEDEELKTAIRKRLTDQYGKKVSKDVLEEMIAQEIKQKIEPPSPETIENIKLYQKAKKGDTKAMWKLINNIWDQGDCIYGGFESSENCFEED